MNINRDKLLDSVHEADFGAVEVIMLFKNFNDLKWSFSYMCSIARDMEYENIIINGFTTLNINGTIYNFFTTESESYKNGFAGFVDPIMYEFIE